MQRQIRAPKPNAIVVGTMIDAIDPDSTCGIGKAMEMRMNQTNNVRWVYIPARLREQASKMGIGSKVIVMRRANRIILDEIMSMHSHGNPVDEAA